MGFLSSAFKGLGDIFGGAWKYFFKPTLSAPFEAVRDTYRGVKNLGQGVGHLAQGDLSAAFDETVAAVGNFAKGSLNIYSNGIVSEGGLIDTKVDKKIDLDSGNFLKTASNSNEAAVAFADAETPDVIIGADEIEENLVKRKSKAQQTGFLGGLNNTGSLLV